MDVVESLEWSHQALTQLKVPHALIGGMALSEYGYSRGTQDVDWLIPEERELKELSDIQELIRKCENLDWSRIKFYADHFNEWSTIQKLKDQK